MKFLTIALAVTVVLLISGWEQTEQTEKVDWALALHGGAGTISKELPDSIIQQYYDGLEEALLTGEKIISEGGSALDAVEMTVRSLENNLLFNAGKGAVFTSEGTHELDAAIMDGSTMAAGAVTGLTTVKNPIILARKIMTDSEHIFLSGSGAEKFADQTDLERVNNDYFHTERRYEQWQQSLKKSGHLQNSQENNEELKFGTVGAVALDSNGKLAAATSTGGRTNKKFGRIGDVPVIGAGTFANQHVAISATGWGEQIMRYVSANTIANLMEFGNKTLEEAMNFLLTEQLDPGDAGFIGVDKDGNISMQMNTPGMFRGSIDSNGNKIVKIWQNE